MLAVQPRGSEHWVSEFADLMLRTITQFKSWSRPLYYAWKERS